MGQQAGDHLHGVAQALPATEVSGRAPPGLQMHDAVLDSDTRRTVHLALALVYLLVSYAPKMLVFF
ncbi:hypothetical protein [Streptomyces sp. NPDC059881]|uniref:hypothetical protein n=1 Tax=Streptomyces sp. NPDC059881 TaxID=3346986 RepID=UPI0036513DC0